MNEKTPKSPLNSVEEPKFPKAEQYVAEKFNELSDDYSSDGVHVRACSLLAADVARLVIVEGGHPRLLSVRGRKIDSTNNTETLVPARYEGRVRWGGHLVCENDGMIYDPMVGTPLALEEYLQATFLGPVESSVSVPNDKIEEFISR